MERANRNGDGDASMRFDAELDQFSRVLLTASFYGLCWLRVTSEDHSHAVEPETSCVC